MEGIDISSAQQHVNWQQIQADGIDFVIAKAHEGGQFKDRRFEDHINGAKSIGACTGGYIYFWGSLEPQSGNAAIWGQTLKAAGCDFVAIDIEIPSPGMAKSEFDFWWVDGAPKPTLRSDNQKLIQERVLKTIELLEDAVGMRVLIYTGSPAWNYLKLGDTFVDSKDLWWAQYAKPASYSLCPRKPLMHQYTGTGQVGGITGNVDRDVWLGDVSIRDWAQSTIITAPTILGVSSGDNWQPQVNASTALPGVVPPSETKDA